MFRSSSKAGRNFHLVLRLKVPKRMPMRLLKWGRKMPSTKQYNLVQNDDFDTRIPLHPDEAFQYGITFQAKYIGTMDVPRPTSRVEIVAAMRRVRYEFKAKGVKKRKVTVSVSTDGVRVTTRKKKSKTKKKDIKLFGSNKSSNGTTDIMHHPIYRIFYVSHDSSDLKIFSYIARDGATNVFKCNVFKSNKKSQAMRIVRTVGQAFEVCHKLSTNTEPLASTSSALDDPAPSDHLSDIPPSKEAVSECGAAASTAICAREEAIEEPPPKIELLPPPPKKDGRRSPQLPVSTPITNLPELPECVTKVDLVYDQPSSDTPLSAQHQLQLLKERLEQQAQQTRAAVAQLLLLRDQLAAEQAARCEAQARTHQLLVHNKELLEHIAALVAHLQERERGNVHSTINAQQLTMLPQAAVGPGPDLMKNLDNYKTNDTRQADTDAIFNLISQSHKVTQNLENNNLRFDPFGITGNGPGIPINGPVTTVSDFSTLSNDQIQNYLINRFQNMGGFAQEQTENLVNGGNNQQFYQNSNAFPNIPPLTNHHSNMDLSSWHNQNVYGVSQSNCGQPANGLGLSAMSLVQSQSSLFSASPAGTSKDSTPDEGPSSDDGIPFIMPLSHNATLTAAGEDGRIRLIVPVSPSPSTTGVAGAAACAATLRVPTSPITRTTSEKVPNRSDMMTAMRAQWTRHTTK